MARAPSPHIKVVSYTSPSSHGVAAGVKEVMQLYQHKEDSVSPHSSPRIAPRKLAASMFEALVRGKRSLSTCKGVKKMR